VDDGSTDETQNILKNQQISKQIQVITNKKNLGKEVIDYLEGGIETYRRKMKKYDINEGNE